MPHNLNSSILCILNKNGNPVGVGFLVSEHLVLTCAHVIDTSESGAPSELVELELSLITERPRVKAKVVYWAESTDIAGLELVDSLPVKAQPVRLVKGSDLWGHAFRAFGFPAGYQNGVWASGRMLDRDANGWLQVEDVKTTGHSVQPGFSGGPIWDEVLDGVAGIVVAADSRAGLKTAYIIPTETLVAAWPVLGDSTSLPCPYRGLLAFREEDGPIFFGRESFIKKLFNAVQNKSLVVVIGPSGSGKSSVVFAGLVPRLRQDESWIITSFRPGSRPFFNLAKILVPLLEPEMSETDRLIEMHKLESALLGSDLQLPDVIERTLQRCKSTQRLLIIADQFEELYTSSVDLSIQERFLQSLLDTLREVKGISLVLTLRADFLEQALAYRPFADALQDADIKLGPMTIDEIHQAVERPAKERGVTFENWLVERILSDVSGQPGNLPLLEFALTLLWDLQKDGLMTHVAYNEIGRIDGALTRYADQVYEQLTPDDQQHIKWIFLQLVNPGVGTKDARRKISREEVNDVMWKLVQQLADKRLVVTDRTLDDKESAELVHEALIHNWSRLRGWIDNERTFRTWQEQLRSELHQWVNSDKDPRALLKDLKLSQAEDWLEKRKEQISDLERTYIRASVEFRHRQRKIEERGRWINIGIISFITILTVITVTMAATGTLNRLIYRPLAMEWVAIPAGEFLMGSFEADPNAAPDQLPQHSVFLSTYEIMKYEVTTRQYTQCVKAGICRPPSSPRYQDPTYENHPIVYVNWEDSYTFCKWSGGRLLSEAEFEKASRGGLEGKQYPWGDDPPDCSKANFRSSSGRCINDTLPVGSFPPNNYGLYDTAGNVWEWVMDYYDEGYYTFSPTENPTGPAVGFYRDRVMRGGSFDSDELNIRNAFRRLQNPDNFSIIIGFRCGRTP